MTRILTAEESERELQATARAIRLGLFQNKPSPPPEYSFWSDV
ncbi:hypothetical protein [Candidatus Liberibacter brunswickensis]